MGASEITIDASAAPGAAPGLEGLTHAFATFAAATERLEHEYAALRERLAALSSELEEKNRLLAASLERERRLEAEALRQSRLAAMGEMAAMLAHEVRNPLGAMELFTGLLLQDLHDRPEAQRLAHQVGRGITDLNHLVTNLLEFTRTQAPRRVPVDCCAALEDALRYTADLRAASRVAVVRRYDGPRVLGLADPDLLRPVLLNLLRNAVQVMPDGGTLTVAARAGRRSVRLEVADTGPGVPAGAREEIFRPFYTTRTKGTGLGLTVARALVGAMGGRLTLRSQAGRGATFAVVLAAGAGGAVEGEEKGEGGGG
jgi:signal transduction histidine kinase